MTPAENLTVRLGGRWYGSYGTCRCPAHDDREPSLSIRDGDRSVLLRCFTGCEPADILKVLRRHGFCPEPVTMAGREKPKPSRSAEDTRRYLRSIWRECRAIAGTLAEHYLRNRCITVELPPGLRFHSALEHSPSGQRLPAMVAAVLGQDGRLCGLHRTFLRADGADKTTVGKTRMMLGAVRGGGVRLATAGSELAVGEGLETCLAYQQITGVPTWSGLSASGLQAIVLPPLPLAATVFVLVDLDQAGELAARVTADRLYREGRIVKLARPIAGKDMNDALRQVKNAQ